MLTCQPLPDGEPEFFELLNLYFPNVFDIKYARFLVCFVCCVVLCCVLRARVCSAHSKTPPNNLQTKNQKRYLMKFCGNLHGGLNKLAEQLEVQRIGPQHQAGSDSLLTSLTFLKLARSFFSGIEGAAKHMGVLYGLGVDGNDAKQPD